MMRAGNEGFCRGLYNMARLTAAKYPPQRPPVATCGADSSLDERPRPFLTVVHRTSVRHACIKPACVVGRVSKGPNGRRQADPKPFVLEKRTNEPCAKRPAVIINLFDRAFHPASRV